MQHSCRFQPRHHTVRVAFLIKIAKTAHVFRRIVRVMENSEESVFIDRCNMQTGYNVNCRKTYNNMYRCIYVPLPKKLVFLLTLFYNWTTSMTIVRTRIMNSNFCAL